MSTAPPFDCIVLGGSYSGLSAALALGRATRRVLVIDAGNPRNASSKAINNLPGNDAISPQAWRDAVLKDLSKYKTVEVVSGTILSAKRVDGPTNRFEVTFKTLDGTQSAQSVASRSAVLAMGVVNAMPAVLDGLPKDRSLWWGSRVFHCPYCSAFETSDKPLGILALPHTSAPDAVGMAGQLSVWAPGKVTLLTDGRPWDKDGFNAAQMGAMEKNNVSIVTDKVASVTQDAGSADIVVEFASARPKLVLYSLHLRPTFSLASPDVIASLGPTQRGPIIQCDPMGKTSVPGLYAAGDAMDMKAQVELAISAGTVAAFGVAGELGMADWNDGALSGRL